MKAMAEQTCGPFANHGMLLIRHVSGKILLKPCQVRVESLLSRDDSVDVSTNSYVKVPKADLVQSFDGESLQGIAHVHGELLPWNRVTIRNGPWKLLMKASPMRWEDQRCGLVDKRVGLVEERGLTVSCRLLGVTRMQCSAEPNNWQVNKRASALQ